jgi:CubicO group peptidase (beta-lactamase class C family)
MSTPLPEDAFPRLDRFCRETVETGVFATSIQISVGIDGVSIDAAYGANLNTSVSPYHLAELHCLTKPLVSWCLLEVASRHGIDPSTPVAHILEEASHLDGAVSIAGICNHSTRLAQPSALDWMTSGKGARPTIGDLRQEPAGTWYSEIGAWVVAERLITVIEERPATEVLAELTQRMRADLFIGKPPPSARSIIVPIAGLPQDPIPMLHVRHPTYQERLGPEFGGLGTMGGLVRFLIEVSKLLRAESSALQVDRSVLQAVHGSEEEPKLNGTWHRPTAFRAGFIDASTPGEPGDDGMLLMFAGIGNAGCLIDPTGDRQVAYYSDAASFDADDHRFLRRRLVDTFLDDSYG